MHRRLKKDHLMVLPFRLFWIFMACAAGLVIGSCAEADLIRLKNGGELRGKLRPGYSRAQVLQLETLTGGIVTVDRKAIEFLSIRSLTVEEYETRAREIPHTVEAHWELAQWCKAKRLNSQRQEQLRKILELDPNHAESRKALGHVQHEGQWMTRDEMMAARGYVKFKGKYVTQQELDLLEKTAAERAAEKKWFAKVYPWVRWLTKGSKARTQEALQELRAITDPAAVAALEKNMAEHNSQAVRRLFVSILAQIPGKNPVKPLVDRSLYDSDHEVRHQAVLAIHESEYETAVAYYLSALLHNDNHVVNRAAGALGQIGDDRTVPALVDALVTNHRYKINVPVKDTISLGTSPNGVGLVDPNVVSQYLPPEIQAQLLTGQLPFGVEVIPVGLPKRTRTVTVQVSQRNQEVLTALQKITGQDFGYDERTWKLWWAAHSNAGGRLEPAS